MRDHSKTSSHIDSTSEPYKVVPLGSGGLVKDPLREYKGQIEEIKGNVEGYNLGGYES